MILKDITGSVFGALTVLNREPNKKDGSAVWQCVCRCGEIRVIAGTGLKAVAVSRLDLLPKKPKPMA